MLQKWEVKILDDDVREYFRNCIYKVLPFTAFVSEQTRRFYSAPNGKFKHSFSVGSANSAIEKCVVFAALNVVSVERNVECVSIRL